MVSLMDYTDSQAAVPQGIETNLLLSTNSYQVLSNGTINQFEMIIGHLMELMVKGILHQNNIGQLNNDRNRV